MNFLSTSWVAWLVAGAAAAAIPVIIHLIHTARAPQVPFPTLRFLKSAAQKTARRRYLENILLMLLRMALFAVLAVALARPFVSESYGLFADTQSTAAVLILDNSYSMDVRFQHDTRFARIKKEAHAILEDARTRPTQACILLTNPGPAAVPDRLLADRAQLFKDIDGAAVSSGRADLVAAMRTAYGLLDKSNATDKRIWVLTDRQALSWQGLDKFDEPAKHLDIPVAILRATEPSFENVAVTDAVVVTPALVPGMPVRIDVTVRNAGPAPEKRGVSLMVDDFALAREKQTVDLAPGGTPGAVRVVSFTYIFDKPGPHRVLAAVDGSDSLDLDHARRLAVQIADRIPVLCVKPGFARAEPGQGTSTGSGQAAVDFLDDNYYLIRALDPTSPAATPGQVPTGGVAESTWPIRPVEVTADKFDPASPSATPGQAAAALEKFDVVILNNIAAPKPAVVKALADYVAAGRTLVIFAGSNVAADDYNRAFMDALAAQGGLLPARLKDRVGESVLHTTVEKITQVQDQSPYLEGLVADAAIYQDVLVYTYLRTDAAPADSVLARLSGGDPLLLEKPFGQGRVILCTTAATKAWTNLPVRNLFLPFMMRVAFLSSRTLGRPSQILAGQVYQANLAPAVRTALSVEVTGPLGPSGEVATELRDTKVDGGRNILRFEKTWNLGYYGWRIPKQAGLPADLSGGASAKLEALAKEGGAFATNVDGAEADLAEVPDEKLATDIGAREVHIAETLSELVTRFEAGARRELWQYLLMIALLVALCEPLVANWLRPDRQLVQSPKSKV
jgi:hypothetical protein